MAFLFMLDPPSNSPCVKYDEHLTFYYTFYHNREVNKKPDRQAIRRHGF